MQISCSWPFWSSMSLRATLKDVTVAIAVILASQTEQQEG